jgi:ATP-dependent helicase/nuclease subunit A
VEEGEAAEAEAETGGDWADKLAAQAQVIKAVLERVRPLEKGLTCAILVRKNDNAQAVAQWLRAHGVPQVVVEGVATLAEQSPVVAALVDALRWLAMPANALAAGHISATPLWDILKLPLQHAEAAEIPAGAVWRHWRSRIADAGSAQITHEWCAALAVAQRAPYAQYCLRQVSQAAQHAGAALALPDWLAALEQLAVRETAAAGSIHVMTIHKAKGLGFDLVFLPDLDSGSGGRDDILISRDGQGGPTGCLSYPPKWLQAWEPALGDLCAAQKAEQDLEALCVLYVALTRAKEATFVILNKEKPRKASPARDWILSAVPNLGQAPTGQPAAEIPWGEGELQWEHGSRDFGAGKKDAQVATAPAQLAPQLPPPVPRRKRRKPSDAGHDSFAEAPTAASSGGGKEFGTAVHEVFEQIEWWSPGQPLEGDENAVGLVRKCLAVPEIRVLFIRETGHDEALRELPVEFMEKDAWWSGIIDRLVLRRDAGGVLRKAVLIDFKTDRVENAAALRDRYSEQLAVYRRAVSTALKLADDQVEVVLLSTCLEKVLQL